VKRALNYTLVALHSVSESITHALGWGLALTCSVDAIERPQLRRVGNVIYLPARGKQ
jgi:hypothetical protein